MLSACTLTVSAAPDRDLMGCIEYLLDRCVDGEGKIAKRFAELPIGMLLRRGCNQHKLGPADIPKLREKAERCLQVC